MKRQSMDNNNNESVPKTPSPRPQKRPKLCVFGWLPDEVLLMILEGLPWQLDGITRLVCRTWWAVINERWNPHCRYGLNYVVPCARWALRNQTITSLLHWLAVDMKAIVNHDQARQAWMNTACDVGNTKIIAWLASKQAPKRIRSQPSTYQVSLAARFGDFDCYRMTLKASGRDRVSADDMYGACMGGRQKTVEWIYTTYKTSQTSDRYPKPALHKCLTHASGCGHTELLGWLLDHEDKKWMGHPVHGQVPSLIDIAVVGGDHDVSVLNWMWAHADHKKILSYEMGAIESPRDFLIDRAHGKSYLPGLRWLQAHGVVEADGYWSSMQACFSPSARRLARFGEVKVLRWMHEYKFVMGLEWARVWGDDNHVILDARHGLISKGSRLLIEDASSSSSSSS